VRLRLVQQVRQLEEQGQVTIVRADADDSSVYDRRFSKRRSQVVNRLRVPCAFGAAFVLVL
jgi:hypothetical protein